MQSLCLNQCWFIVDWTPDDEPQRKNYFWENAFNVFFLQNVCHFVDVWICWKWKLLYCWNSWVHLQLRLSIFVVFLWCYSTSFTCLNHSIGPIAPGNKQLPGQQDFQFQSNLKTDQFSTDIVAWSVTRATSFNSLWPSDARWRHRSGSTLALVMACCLMVPSHYMNQCWLPISEILWHSPESNFMSTA